MSKSIVLAAAACVAAACSAVRPDTVVSPQLDSGITSSNGGGARVVNSSPGLAITTPAPAAR